MPPLQLISTHIRRVLARKYADGKMVTNTHPFEVMQDHAGYVFVVEDSKNLADETIQTATMRRKGG